MDLHLTRIGSPLGPLLLVHDGVSLRALEFEDNRARMLRALERHYGAVSLTNGWYRFASALESYFAGDVTAPDKIRVEPAGTEFQRRVWSALREIPPGATATYGQIAASLGTPTASRAVGLANGANPIAIVIPCHRVIGADGSLTGYSGGIGRKQFLLRHEGSRTQ